MDILCEALTVIADLFVLIVGNEPDWNVKSPEDRTVSEIVTLPLLRAVGRSILTNVVISVVVPLACERFIDLPETDTLPPRTLTTVSGFKETDTFFLTSA